MMQCMPLHLKKSIKHFGEKQYGLILKKGTTDSDFDSVDGEV